MQCLHFLMFAMLSTCFVLWLSWSNCYCFVTWAFFHPGFSFLYVLVFCFDIVGNLVAANTVIIGCSFYWSKGLIYPLSKKKKSTLLNFLRIRSEDWHTQLFGIRWIWKFHSHSKNSRCGFLVLWYHPLLHILDSSRSWLQFSITKSWKICSLALF